MAAAVEAEIDRLERQTATLRRLRETLLSVAWRRGPTSCWNEVCDGKK
jgi:hypothetical protein